MKILGKGNKVTIIKLSSNGHTAIQASYSVAYNIISQSLDEGKFVYYEPDKVIVSKRHDLQRKKFTKVIIFTPVCGG